MFETYMYPYIICVTVDNLTIINTACFVRHCRQWLQMNYWFSTSVRSFADTHKLFLLLSYILCSLSNASIFYHCHCVQVC